MSKNGRFSNSEYMKMVLPLADEVDELTNQYMDTCKTEMDNRERLILLTQKMQNLPQSMGIHIESEEALTEISPAFLGDINRQIDQLVEQAVIRAEEMDFRRFPKLETLDIIACCVAGIISVVIDIAFVGTPEVVRIYQGGERFSGSILTELFRQLGRNPDGKLNSIFHFLSNKCKVPYDVSAVKGVVTPNNHRLRSLAHDPLLGLIFAVADIFMGSTTCIDNTGCLTILPGNAGTSTQQKCCAVFLYLGHLLSDLCTARGLPIPGSFLSQFMKNGPQEESVAEIVEDMYYNGYDLRHLFSMSVPIAIKDMLVKAYLTITAEKPIMITSLMEKEKRQLDYELKKIKMLFCANALATVGNTIKFFAPPNCGNPCALNIAQWLALLQTGFKMVKAELREVSAEEAMVNRERIDKTWFELFEVI